MKLVNVGCGDTIHRDWSNLDLEARLPGIVPHDLRRGLPFGDDSCDVVYHSHVLEHLSLPDARRLLAECLRVLKPAGTLRIVVPDLENIARAYLAKLDETERNPAAGPDHEWMTLELLDQMVRTRSGGDMSQYLQDPVLAQRAFVQSRMELRVDPPHGLSRPRARLGRGVAKWFARMRRYTAVSLVTLVAGRATGACAREAFFRQRGELHRWMYDRVSLRRLLLDTGFSDVTPCAAHESRIPGFPAYQLDVVEGRVRKPDSLFVEAVKPPSR